MVDIKKPLQQEFVILVMIPVKDVLAPITMNVLVVIVEQDFYLIMFVIYIVLHNISLMRQI